MVHADRERFEPLTIRDDFSRHVLCAQAMQDACSETVRRQMIEVFERYGLPEVIRSDNGVPFAAPKSPLGLSRLSAWWLSLGINLDRIAPGRPDQNGGHERMHRDIARELERQASEDSAGQQAELDVWRKTFNEERPHEALGMRVPQEVYRASSRRFDPTPVEVVYPREHLVRKVNNIGAVKIQSRTVSVSLALRGFPVGLESLNEHRWAVWFCRLCLGEIDLSTHKFHAAGPATRNESDAEEASP